MVEKNPAPDTIPLIQVHAITEQKQNAHYFLAWANEKRIQHQNPATEGENIGGMFFSIKFSVDERSAPLALGW